MAGPPNLAYSDLIASIRNLIPSDQKLYLVGGAVRDMLLDRQTHDLDFITWVDVRRFARQVADMVGGAFYMLDDQRNTARIICPDTGVLPKIIDVALIRSDTLDGDLQSRDFTINAMAIDLERPEVLIDPLGGAVDLKKKRLRPCSPSSFIDDPLRILRSVRLAYELKLQIDETIPVLIQQALPKLMNVSSERLRDELFRILDGKYAHKGLAFLHQLGVIGLVMPELEMVENKIQAETGTQGGWGNILSPVGSLESIFIVLQEDKTENEGLPENMAASLNEVLGCYKQNIGSYLNASIAGDRTRKSLLLFACLYLQVAKREIDPIGSTVKSNHFNKLIDGKKVILKRARALTLSTAEGDYLENLATNYKDFPQLSGGGTSISRRYIYQYFRRTEEAGVGICFLHLADLLANFKYKITLERWLIELNICERLFKAWWEESQEIIHPPRLLSGDDLQDQFGLIPGPQVGELLEAIREAQASGEVIDRKGAIHFASAWLGEDI